MSISEKGVIKEGRNTTALEGTNVQTIYTVTSGRKFKLKLIVVANEHASENAVVELYDQAGGSAPTAANQKFPPIIVGPQETVVIDLRNDGPTFETAVSGFLSGGTGTVAAYSAYVSGYEY